MITQITGKLTYADGAPVFGTAVISWPPYMLYGMSIAGGMKELVIEDGVINVGLYPVGPSSPQGVYYTVRFELEHGPVYEEFWIVPDTVSATIEQIRVNFPLEPSMYISPAQMTGMGAQPGMILSWNGANWVGGWVTMTNVDPSYIRFEVGTEGTDFNIEGSPAHLGGTAIFNVPSASQTARGVVTTGDQTFAGNKTFTGSIVVSGTISGPTIDALDNRLDVLETTPAAVQSVFGRFGVVVAKQDDYSVGMVTGAVPNSLMILTDNTLSGGGDLTQNRTLSVVPEKTVQKVRVSSAGVPIGAQPELGFTSSGTVSVNVTDDAPNNRVNIAIDASSVGLLPDPTQDRGDLIVRNITSVDRLPVGVDGEVLVVDSVATLGVRWAPPPDTGIPITRRIIAGPGLAGGGDLSADVTLSAPDDVTVQKIRFSRAATFVAARRELNFVPGANITLTVSDTDEITNRVDVGISATPGAGGFPSTYQVNGSLIGIRSTLNLIAGTNITLIGTDNTTVPGSERIDITVNSTAAGVPLTRQVIAGTGLTGGGALSADVTLSVVPRSTVQKLDISTNDGATAAQPALNFLAGTGVTISQANNVALSRVDVTINATGSPQTPWTDHHNAAGFQLRNTSAVGIGTATPLRPVHIVTADYGEFAIESSSVADGATTGRVWGISNASGNLGVRTVNAAFTDSRTVLILKAAGGASLLGDMDISGVYRVNGVPISTGGGGSQTPWTSNIDAAGFTLLNAGAVYAKALVAYGDSGVNHAAVNFQVAGFTRWQLGINSDAPNFDIIRLNSAGTFVDIPLRIKAADGDIEVANNLYISNSGGTAGNTFRLDGFTDTMYMVAQGPVAKLALMTGDYARLMVHPNGFVGIGTGASTPENLLTIDNGHAVIRSGNSLMFRPADNSWHMTIMSTANTLQVYSGGGGTAIATFAHGGNVGLLTASPNARLHIVNEPLLGYPVAGQVKGAFYISDVTQGWGMQMGNFGNGDCWIQTQRSDGNVTCYNLLLNPIGGFVAIGNTAPAYMLDVAGDVNARQDLRASRYVWAAHMNTPANDIGGVGPTHIAVQTGDSFIRWQTPANFLAAVSVFNTAGYGTTTDWGADFNATGFHRRRWTEAPSGGPVAGWWFIENIKYSGGNYGVQLAWGWETNASKTYTRNIQNGVFGGWVEYVMNDSRTYSIGISGNAGSANTVQGYGLAPDAGVNGGYQLVHSSADGMVRVNLAGYLYTHYINCNTGPESGTIDHFVTTQGDAFYRKAPIAHVRSQLGGVYQDTKPRFLGVDVTGSGLFGLSVGTNLAAADTYGGFYWDTATSQLRIYYGGRGTKIWMVPTTGDLYMDIPSAGGPAGKIWRSGNQLMIS